MNWNWKNLISAPNDLQDLPSPAYGLAPSYNSSNLSPPPHTIHLVQNIHYILFKSNHFKMFKRF